MTGRAQVIANQGVALSSNGTATMQHGSTMIPLRCQLPRRFGGWLPLLICLVLMIPGSIWAGGLPESWDGLGLPGTSSRSWETCVTTTSVADLSLATAGDMLGLQPLFSSAVDPETPDVKLTVLKAKKRFLDPIVHLAAPLSTVTFRRGGSIPLYLAHRSLLC
jgi:hypothetical protein